MSRTFRSRAISTTVADGDGDGGSLLGAELGDSVGGIDPDGGTDDGVGVTWGVDRAVGVGVGVDPGAEGEGAVDDDGLGVGVAGG